MLLNRKAEEEGGFPFVTVILTILVIITIAVAVTFIYNAKHIGEETVQEQVLAFGTNATEAGECLLWASGVLDDKQFNCAETPCSLETLCKACTHFGKEFSISAKKYVWVVDGKNCILPDKTGFGQTAGAGCGGCV